ncbi:hypothetical protein MY5147_007016 [Beauveria neobassiana]
MRQTALTPTPMPALAPVFRPEADSEEEAGVEALELPTKVEVDIVDAVGVVVAPVVAHCGSGYVAPSLIFWSITFKLTFGEYAVSVGDLPALEARSSTKRHVLLDGGDGLQLATQKRLEPLPELAVELKAQTRIQGGPVPLGPWLHSRWMYWKGVEGDETHDMLTQSCDPQVVRIAP